MKMLNLVTWIMKMSITILYLGIIIIKLIMLILVIIIKLITKQFKAKLISKIK